MKNQKVKVMEKAGGIGFNYVVRTADLSTPEAKNLHQEIIEKREKGEPIIDLIRELNNKFGRVVCEGHNIVPTVGLTVLAKSISGNLAALSDIEINYGAVGTGTGTPALANTTLGSEEFRKLPASLTYSGAVAYATLFYAATDFTTTGIGNITEHGLFIDGSTGVDTGTLFSRVLLNSPTGVSKTNLQTLTIDYEGTFANA